MHYNHSTLKKKTHLKEIIKSPITTHLCPQQYTACKAKSTRFFFCITKKKFYRKKHYHYLSFSITMKVLSSSFIFKIRQTPKTRHQSRWINTNTTEKKYTHT